MTTRKHEEIADSLTRDILVGQYRTGERLPSERDLAARFDANRGAVREAMKKLEHLGIACVQPGGARVAPLHEASLDVIGHLLAIDAVPSQDLVEQILAVMQQLVTLAAETAVTRASDAELAAIRERVRPLLQGEPDGARETAARIELMSAIMAASGNLVCRLIARALLAQFGSSMAPLENRFQVDADAYRRNVRRLDDALARRDVGAVRATFETFFDINRHATRQAYAALDGQPPRANGGARS
jgi:GntR family transcriptional regulator, transcriptional repressor for pyruvate dehydrogenase complex